MNMREKKHEMRATPFINVTPLIDVLLVLLIIFMVVTPLKPARFKAMIPEPPSDLHIEPNPKTLVVTINPDLSLRLNGLKEDMGSVNDTARLSARLAGLFEQRKEARVYRDGINLSELTEEERVERTVFIKAPRAVSYGEVAKVIDGVKGAGAEPIGLQIDSLD